MLVLAVAATSPGYAAAYTYSAPYAGRRVAEEVAKNAGAPAGEHWKVVLDVIDSASGPSLQS